MVLKTSNGRATIDNGEATIYVNGKSYETNQYYLKIIERMNEVPSIEGRFFDIADDNTDLVRGNQVYLKANGVVVSPLFEIKKSNEQSDTFRNISGYGFVEGKLSDFVVEKTAAANADSQSGRPQYDGVLAGTIVSQQLALYSTGVTQGTVDSDYASIRSENDTLLSFFAGISNVVSKEWFASYSSDLATRYFNITTRGTDKSGSITLAMSGDGQNCLSTERLEDYEALKNEVKCLGYGDGINQLESYADHSTSIRSKLSSTISSDGTTASLIDASDFPSSGSIWIGCEKCNYSGKSSNDLTGLSRGVEFRGNVKSAYQHSINSPVCSGAYSSTSPQSSGNGSSINTHGRKQKSITLKEVIDQSTLDIIAEKLLLERKGTGATYSPPDRITVQPSDYNWALANIFVGDQVTITDDDSNLNGTYRCYGKIFVYDVENGNVGLTLEFSNTTFNVLTEIAREQNESVNLQKYMQGSTNIYQVNLSENCSSGKYLDLRFYIPEDAIAINRVKVNFKLKPFRAYETTNQNESSHTHGIPSLTVNGTSTQSNTSGGTTPSSIAGVSVWGTFTVRYADGNHKSLAYVYKNVVGNPPYYTTRVQCMLMNITGSTKSVTPYYELPCGSSGSFEINYSLSNNSVVSWEYGYSSTSNETGYYKCYDNNFNCSSCKGQIENIYTHTHGSHSHSIPSLTVNGSTTQSSTSNAGSAHTHGINFGIYEESLSGQSVDIYSGIDGSESFVGTYNSDQTDLLINNINVAGNWYNIQFRPNKNMRIEANVYIQVFLNSR